MIHKSRYIIILLGILCVAPTVVSLVLTAHSFWIKHEMLERLENEQLHKIVLMPEDVHWYEKGSELIIGGELFDVKEFKEENGKFVCWGIFDTEETALSNWIEDQNEKNEDDRIITKMLVQLLQLPLIETNSTVKITSPQKMGALYGNLYCELPTSPFLKGSHPPPDCFLM